MQSLIHLYNTALAELGGEQIPLNISPIESDTTGAICQSVFPHVLDTVLESYEWGFAKSRSTLASILPQKAQRRAYAFYYALPADCLKPIRIENPCGENPYYSIEGEYIACNVEQAELLYVARVVEPKRWPAYFANVLVWKMAASLATARNNDKQQKQICEEMYERALSIACAKDRAMQNEQRNFSPWQIARGNIFIRRR